MRDLRECLQRFRTDVLGRRIRRGQLRKRRFKIDQFPIKLVIFAIADRRRRFFVIAPIVFLNFFAQRNNSLFCARLVMRHEA